MNARKLAIHALLCLGGATFLMPLGWMLLTSIKPLDQVMDITALPIPPRFPENYIEALAHMRHFGRYTANTLFLCTVNVLGVTFSSALAAYGFAHLSWRGRDAVFAVTLATMMVPFAVTLVPTYTLFRALGWIGTYRPLWVPACFGGAFFIFLLRQFFLTLPRDLLDAARIDGAGELEIFFRVVVPLSIPALSVVALFQFIGVWKDFMGPLIYLTDPKDFTLSLGLQFFQSQHGGARWHHLMAASTVVSAPLIVLFFFTQKTFIQGIAMTGLKG